MSLATHLLGQSRSAVLGALFLHPESSLHVRELARATGTSAGSLHRELRMLSELGLLEREEIGRQVHYRANRSSPIFGELASILRKTSGLADVLKDALTTVNDKVELAFVYGSVAAGNERAASDVDLMVLGKAGFADLANALSAAQEVLRRDVNPTVMTTVEFSRMLASGDGFARSVIQGPKIWLKGQEDDIAKLATHRQAQGTRSGRR